MRLHILAVGRLKRAPEQTLAEDYLNRAAKLGRQAGVTSVSFVETAESRVATASLRRKEEASLLLARIPAKSYVISLEQAGKELTTGGFANELGRLIGRVADLAFLIGGPDGHGEEIKRRADLQLSLGKLTWPHRLARLMLSEQIYRAVTILVNHPYHRA
jgi:23S rRNA (pseudouridine1915-N3)-methyltransferase